MPDDDNAGMEKYAVIEDNGSTKLAQDATGAKGTKRCPNCGNLLEVLDKINVLKCPECGTLPFEPRKE